MELPQLKRLCSTALCGTVQPDTAEQLLEQAQAFQAEPLLAYAGRIVRELRRRPGYRSTRGTASSDGQGDGGSKRGSESGMASAVVAEPIPTLPLSMAGGGATDRSEAQYYDDL